MKLITAPLNSESSSSKIVNLQAGLLVLLRRNLLQLESDEALRLADDITQDWQERRYNDATRSAVIAFQRIKELNETGEIDEATANNLNEDLQVLGVLDREVLPIPMPSPLHKYVVRGQVKTSDGQPIAGSIVQVFDRDLRREQPLDEVVTDADGKYEIRYSPQQLLCPELGRGDLTVRVVHNDQPLVSHPTIYGAGSEEIANLTADMPLPTEFHQLHTKLQPLLGDVPIPDLTDPDLTYLAGTAGLQTEQVLNLKKSEIYGNETQIPANVFYAWFQQGLPTDLDSLLTQKGSSLRRALQNAAEANQLPAELRDRQDEFIDQVTQLRVEQVLKPGTNGRASLGDLLGTVRLQLDQNKQQIFANRWVSYEGDSEQFWNTLQDQFNPNEITDLRLTTELGTLTGNHLSLIRELQKVRPADATSLRYLVEKDLPQLVQSVGVPSDIPGTGEEQRQYYVEQLEYHLENQFPTALIAARIKQNQFVVPANIRSQVANFFNQNQDFEFGKQHISAYLQGANLAGIASEDVPSLKAELMSIERIFNLIPPAPALNLTSNGADQTVVDDSQSRNIGQNQGNAIHGALTDAATPRDIPFSPRYPLASALRQAGFDSAHQIVSHGRQNFRNAVSLRLPGGEKIAEVLFDQASHKSAMVQAMFSKYGKRFNSTDLAILPGFNPTPEQEQELTKHIPEWRELFGNIDFCKCEHCQSVYGPAAYLVEILQFLGQCKLSDGQTLQTRLFNSSRRPDLGEIQLTCKNTNTEMPYVDLVNEILENAVFPRSDQNGNVPYPQTTWTSDELAANPENLYVPTYDRLKQATFPWTLPFDLWVEQARIYLEHIGIRRYELMETLKPDQRFLDMAVAQEHLGLIKEEADLITTVDSSDSWKYWGLEERNNILKDPRDGSDVTGEWWAVLKHVSILLKQSGLTYPELLNLLNLRCINPSNIQPTIEDDSCSLDNCNLSKMQVSWLYGPIFAEIQAFTRLWRRLGWSMHDLDRAIMAFYGSIRSGNPDVNTLLFISHVQRLKEKLNISVSTILLWCIPNWVHKIDTWLYLDYSKDEQIIIPSLYDQLFQNYTVISPPDEAFKLTPSRDELNKFKDASNQNQPLPTISEHQVSVIAALGITAKDLSLLLPNNLSLVSYGSGCEDRLNLDNLSCLYRIVSFAKALRLSVQDWFRVVALTGVYPFPVMAQHPEPRVKIFQLIEEVDRIRKSGFSIAEVDYLIRHQTIGAFGAMPVEAQISQALSRIRSGLQQIDTETQLQPDLDGKLTQKMLSRLGWDVGLIELLMSGEYLNSPLFIEAPLDHLPTDLRFPDSLPECLKSRLSFNQQGVVA